MSIPILREADRLCGNSSKQYWNVYGPATGIFHGKVMLRELVRAHHTTIVEYELCFDDGHNNGFGFPCDKNGTVNIQPEAAANLAWCMEHPGKFVRFNEVVRYEREYLEPGRGRCSCGTEVELFDQYYGACQCPNCGRWYNLFGQELLPPDQWECDPADEEYW